VSWTNQHRWQAVRTAAKRLGATAQRLGPFAATYQSGAGAADALLAGRATAAIAFNDMIALGMLARFRDRGVPVPGQVSVIGFDDVFAARTCSPPLTTLAAPVENLGRTSVRLLLDDTTADAGRHGPVLLPSHLVVRGSTGPV
jgi:LacI family transcriptional regulator